jgi:WD40 repeat protein
MSGCPARERLERFLANECPEAERAALADHVGACPSCRDTVTFLQDQSGPESLRGLLSEAPAEEREAEKRFVERLKQGPPWRVPGHELLGELGRGGMGVVYKARHVGLGRLVAVKMILAGGQAGEQDRQRFLGEARAAAGLRHPNIVAVHEVGEYEAGGGACLPFFSLELVEGGTLAQRLRGEPQPPRAAAELVEVLAQAVQHAHDNGVVHRDLKPANVLLTADGSPKVGDFGLAKRLDGADGRTPTGAVLGTPSYMAPEQAGGVTRAVGPAADVYALGAILYEMLTGRPPFKSEQPIDTVLQVLRDDPVPPRRLVPSVPRDLETICLKCLRKEPARRYAGATALADDLRRFLDDRPIEARPAGRLERCGRWCRRHPAGAALVLALAVVLAAGAWAALAGVREANARSAASQAQAEEARANEQAEKARAEKAEEGRKRAEAEARAKLAGARRAEAERRERQARGLPLLLQAAAARAERFDQKAALDLAQALTYHDGPELRAELMEAIQRSLVPVRASARRAPFGTIAYSPDGKYLIAGNGVTGALHVWRTDGWVETTVLEGHGRMPALVGMNVSGGMVRGLAFHPDRADELLSAGVDGTVRAWSLSTGKELAKAGTPGVPLLALAVEPGPRPAGERLLLTGDASGKLVWWNLDGLGTVKEASAGPGLVSAVAYRPDGKQCASVGADGVVRLWGRDGKHEAGLVVPGRPMRLAPAALTLWMNRAHVGGMLAFGPHGPLALLSAFYLQPEDYGMMSLAYSADGAELAAAGSDGRVYVWDVRRRALRHVLEGHEVGAPPWGARVMRLAYASGHTLFSGGADGTVREWDTKTGKQVRACLRHGNGPWLSPCVYGLAVRPDGREVVSAGGDLALRTWDTTARRPGPRLEGRTTLLPGAAWPFAVSAFCPDRHHLITADEAFLLAWDTKALRERRAYPGPGPHEPEAWLRQNVTALAMHPEGDRFVSAHVDGELQFWETASGRRLARSKGHAPPDRQLLAESAKRLGHSAPGAVLPAVTALAWSHDGYEVASAGLDDMIRLWGPRTGKLIAEWPDDVRVPWAEPPGSPGRAAREVVAAPFAGRFDSNALRSVLLFAPEDRYLLSAGRDSVLRVWDVETRQLAGRLRGHVRRVTAAAFSGNGRLLASGSDDGMVVVWDWHKREQVRALSLAPLMAPERFGSAVESGGPGPGNQHVQEQVLKRRSTTVGGLAFSPDARWLAVTLGDGSVSLVDLAIGTATYRGIGHEPDQQGLCRVTPYFTSSGELLTVGSDSALRGWGQPAWVAGARAVAVEWGAKSLAVAPDGAEWAAVAWGGKLHRFDARTGKPLTWWLGWGELATTLAYGPGLGRLVLGTQSGKAVILDRKTGRVTASFAAPAGVKGPVNAVAAQPGGGLLAFAWGGEARLWHVQERKWGEIVVRGKAAVSSLAFRPDGGELAVMDVDGNLTLWDVASGRARLLLRGPRSAVSTSYSPEGLSYSPDGKRLAQVGSGLFTEAVVIWETDTGKRLQAFTGHRPSAAGPDWLNVFVSGADHSPDGKVLATCGNDGTIRLWEWGKDRRYRPVAVLSTAQASYERSFQSDGGPLPLPDAVRNSGLRAVRFGDNGRRLIVVANHGPVRVFDLELVWAERTKPAAELLAEAENLTGLRRLENTVAPRTRNRLVLERPAEKGEGLAARLKGLFQPKYQQERAQASLGLAEARKGNHRRAVAQAGPAARRQVLPGDVLYQLACVYALSAKAARADGKLAGAERDRLAEQYAGRAVELLFRARRAGHFEAPANFRLLEEGPGLEPVRKRPDFLQFLERARRGRAS